jgi:hypothetical protein
MTRDVYVRSDLGMHLLSERIREFVLRYLGLEGF